jgi:hypothetical protein
MPALKPSPTDRTRLSATVLRPNRYEARATAVRQAGKMHQYIIAIGRSRSHAITRPISARLLSF